MNQKAYIKTAITIFLLAGLLHLLRSIYQAQLIIGQYTIPLWVSYLLVLLAAFMFYKGLKLTKSYK